MSSTFQDMGAEREVLVKRVFPALRERCSARGVALAEVDLRWGITAEDAEDGKVLDICLREIEACVPYFVAILGDRYGWVPERVDPRLRERHAGLPELEGLSATAIEIRYGLLSTAARRERATFYLRASTLARGQQDPRQEALRTEVRASGALVREGYASLEEFAAWVSRDLAEMIDADFPDTPSGDAFDAALRRQSSHLLLSRPAPIVARELLQALDRERGGALAIVGPAGCGKSTLVRHWLRHRAAVPGEDVVLCIIGVTVPADLRALLKFLCAALRFPDRADLPESLDALRLLFADLLDERGSHGALLLVLDGLDRLPERDGGGALTWLPELPAAGVRIVATAAPGRSAEQLAARQWPHLRPGPLDDAQRIRLATDYLAVYAKKPTQGQLQRIAQAEAFGTPLFAVTLLEELRVFGSFEGLDAELERYAACTTPQALFDQLLARFERDFDGASPGMVQACLCPLVLAREGLDEAQIRLLAGSDDPLPMAHWSPFRFALRPYLGDIDGVLSIGCTPLADAIRQRYLPTADHERGARDRLATRLQERLDTRWIRERLWQVAEGPLPSQLTAFLRDPGLLTLAAAHCWADLVRAAKAWDAGSRVDPCSTLDVDDWPAEPLALLAQLLSEADIDPRPAEQQILQADEERSPGMLADLAMLASLDAHPMADAIRKDIDAGRAGCWGRMHRRMIGSGLSGLRLERNGEGIVARTWETTPPAPRGPVVAEFLYTGHGRDKAWLRHAESDPARKTAQQLLNLAGVEVGHGHFKGAVATPMSAKTPTADEIAKAVALYDAAREIYAGLDDLDRLAFIGARKCTLDLPAQDWGRLLAQAKRDQVRALELNRMDAAMQFGFLRGRAALRLSSRRDVTGAFRALRESMPRIAATGDVRAHAMCAALLEELRTALRTLPDDSGRESSARRPGGLLERLRSLLRR